MLDQERARKLLGSHTHLYVPCRHPAGQGCISTENCRGLRNEFRSLNVTNPPASGHNVFQSPGTGPERGALAADDTKRFVPSVSLSLAFSVPWLSYGDRKTQTEHRVPECHRHEN